MGGGHDQRVGGKGLQLLPPVLHLTAAAPVVLTTPVPGRPTSRQALALGAAGLLVKVFVIWLIAVSITLFVVYYRVEEARALHWRLEDLRRDLDTARRDLADARKKIERGSVAA